MRRPRRRLPQEAAWDGAAWDLATQTLNMKKI